LDNQYYIEIETGRRAKATKTIVFDTVGWIVDYLDEAPVRYAYSDDVFKRKFMKEKPMSKMKFTREMEYVIEAITMYDSLSQSQMLIDEILITNSTDGELQEIIEELRNDLHVHMDKLNKFIFSNAEFEV
jgi:hypothetical protein